MTNQNQNLHHPKFSVYLKEDNKLYPIRVVRANGWDRFIIRVIHAHIRQEAKESTSTLELLEKEFGSFLYAKNKEKAYAEYKDLLDMKPIDQLGVNIKAGEK